MTYGKNSKDKRVCFSKALEKKYERRLFFASSHERKAILKSFVISFTRANRISFSYIFVPSTCERCAVSFLVNQWKTLAAALRPTKVLTSSKLICFMLHA